MRYAFRPAACIWTAPWAAAGIPARFWPAAAAWWASIATRRRLPPRARASPNMASGLRPFAAIFTTRRRSCRGRIRLLPGFSAPSRTLTRRTVCRNPHGGPLRQCVHAVLVRTGRGVSAGPGEDKGDRQPFPCGVPLMPRLVSLDPARRRSAPDTGIRGRSVWRCGCSCPPTRPKQHLHGRRWRSWR